MMMTNDDDEKCSDCCKWQPSKGKLNIKFPSTCHAYMKAIEDTPILNLQSS